MKTLLIGLLAGSAALIVPLAAQEAPVSLGSATSADYGDYLTGADGLALYMFTADTQSTDGAEAVSACYDGCAAAWPPLTGTVELGEGLDEALLGTITRTDGTMQVTYNGWPLYYYAQDTDADDTTGQGVGERWYLLDPMGMPIGM